MAEKIGSIYWELDLNKGSFNEDLAAASQKATGLKGVIAANETAFKSLAVALAGVSIAIVKFASDSMKAYDVQTKSLSELNAVISSTGGKAGVTATAATQLAQSLQKVTQFSDENIEHGQALLLTFTNIGKDIFPQATEAMLNMSQVMGIDLQESAVRIGRALQDPIKGTQLLRRSGIDFNDSQMQTIQTLVQTGRGMEAQKLIMQELDKELGNQARAYGETLPGKMAILKNSINDVQETIGGLIESAIAPLVEGGKSWIQTNEKTVVSLFLGVGAAVAFAVAIVGMVGAIALAIAILSGPLVAILVIIAGLIGVVVYKAVGNLYDQFKKTANSVVSGAKAIGNGITKDFGQAGNATDDLRRKLADIDAQIKISERNFQESMANIVDTHQKAIDNITQQLADEKDSFDQSNADRLDSLDSSLSDESTLHDENSTKLKADYDAIAAWGNRTDKIKLAAAKKAMDDEETRHTEQVKKLQDNYNKDLTNATTAYEKKKNTLEAQLNTELEFIKKHEAEVTSVKDVARLDEIDKLKRAHAEELAGFEKQKQDAIRTSAQTVAGVNSNFDQLGANLPGVLSKMNLSAAISSEQIKQSFLLAFQQIGQAALSILQQAGSTIAIYFGIWWQNIRQGFVTFWNELSRDFRTQNWAQLIRDVMRVIANGIFENFEQLIKAALMALPGGTIMANKIHLPRFAKGVDNFSGGMALVGEQGPELAYLPRGSSVFSNSNLNRLASMLAGNQMSMATAGGPPIHLHVGVFAGTPGEGRKFAEWVSNEVSKISRIRGDK